MENQITQSKSIMILIETEINSNVFAKHTNILSGKFYSKNVWFEYLTKKYYLFN